MLKITDTITVIADHVEAFEQAIKESTTVKLLKKHMDKSIHETTVFYDIEFRYAGDVYKLGRRVSEIIYK